MKPSIKSVSTHQSISPSPHVGAYPDMTINPSIAPSSATTYNTPSLRDPSRHRMVGGTRGHTGARGSKPSCAQRQGQSDSTWERSCPFSEAFCAMRPGKERSYNRWTEDQLLTTGIYFWNWPAIKTPLGDPGTERKPPET